VRPYVGMPATYSNGRDDWAGEITDVSMTGYKIVFKAKRGLERVATLREDGSYRPVGQRHSIIYLGKAEDYRDPSF
jgi:hypothetical protein